MNKYLLGALSLWSIVYLSCVTEKNVSNSVGVDQSNDDILGRPRFEKPALRLVNSIQLSWIPILGASGYELQESESSDFTVISGSWTISGDSIELNYEDNAVRWYRIRSFDPQRTSRWSAILRLDPRDL